MTITNGLTKLDQSEITEMQLHVRHILGRQLQAWKVTF
jgi:hypothetical protein